MFTLAPFPVNCLGPHGLSTGIKEKWRLFTFVQGFMFQKCICKAVTSIKTGLVPSITSNDRRTGVKVSHVANYELPSTNKAILADGLTPFCLRSGDPQGGSAMLAMPFWESRSTLAQLSALD